MDPGLLIVRGRLELYWSWDGYLYKFSHVFVKGMRVIVLHINAFLVKDILINPEP